MNSVMMLFTKTVRIFIGCTDIFMIRMATRIFIYQNVAAPIAPLLKNEILEIQQIARISHTGMVFLVDDTKILENNACFADPEILNIFDFKGLPNDENLLKEPNTLIISDKAAQRFFSNNRCCREDVRSKRRIRKQIQLPRTGGV